jgi:hypothetical protein
MLNRKLHAVTLALALALVNSCGYSVGSGQITGRVGGSTHAPALAQSYNQLPLYFVENRGQADPRVAFYAPGQSETLYFTPDGLTFAFTAGPIPKSQAPTSVAQPGEITPAAKRWAVKLNFIGADANVRPLGENKTEAVFSYFTGRPSQWQGGLLTYAQIRYPDLWPGIDLVFSGQVNRLKYEFVVQPGANPAQIMLAYRGASAVRLTADGELEVTTPLGGFRDAAPLAYQLKNGHRVPVDMRYVLSQSDSTGDVANYAYGFHLGAYDPALPVVLDPAVMVYAGYIGGVIGDYGRGIAVDDLGNAYVAGVTISDQMTFPVTGGPDLTYNGGSYDIFVAKVNPAGTALIYAGYIGGARSEAGEAIAVDKDGNAYITGYTYSDQTTFPVTVGPDLTFNGGSTDFDAFVVKVNAAGTALDYAGYIGGSGPDAGYAIALDVAGNAYVTGYTLSDQTTFPVVGGPDLTFNGGSDAFVAKVNSAGTALDFAGYIGGSGDDVGAGIAVDGTGNAHIAGQTTSDQATFPVTGGPGLTYNGGGDAFVATVNQPGTALDYAGYIGGSGNDTANAIALDGAGNAYVTGQTNSDQTSFPVMGGPDLTFNGGASDVFLAKVNSAGDGLLYAGYIGGAGQDIGYGIAVDRQGNAYVTGLTASDETTFPVAGGPYLTYSGGSGDAFVAKVKTDGTGLGYAGYIGGAAFDQGNAVAVDSAGNAYVTGQTVSDQASFPAMVGPDLTYNGANDAFVAKVSTIHTWTGAIDTDWNKAGNWSPEGVPALGDGRDCLLPPGLAIYPSASSSVIGCDGTLTIAAGAQLATDAVDYNPGQAVSVDGTWHASNNIDFHGANTAVNINAGGSLMLDNASIGNFSVLSTTVNAVTVSGTVQLGGIVHIYHGTSLVVNPTGRVVLPISSTLEIRDAGTLTNNGLLQQDRLVTGPTEFLHITDGAVTDKYYGVVITPTAGSLLTTTVSLQGNQTCTTLTVARCYTITPSTLDTATVAFYYAAAEANGNIAPNAYHWNGLSWDALASTPGGSGIGTFVVATGVASFSPFALADSAPVGIPFVHLFLPLLLR